MNNTRRIKTFIGAMMLAAADHRGIRNLREPRAAHLLRSGSSGAGGGHFADESQAAGNQRQHVGEPAIPADGGRQSERCRSSGHHLRFDRGAVLAAEECEVQPAADGLQPEHDGVCQLPGEPDVPCPLAAVCSGVRVRLGLVLATATLFLGQTAPVAAIVAVSEGKAAGQIWWSLAHLSFPYYVVSAGVTTMVQAVSSHMGWGLALAVFPVMYGIHRSYRTYFGAIDENLRAEALRPEGRVRAASAGA